MKRIFLFLVLTRVKLVSMGYYFSVAAELITP